MATADVGDALDGVDAVLTVRRVAAQDGAALEALFCQADCPCFCRYWDYPGDARAWQNRCANERDENRRELDAALQTLSAPLPEASSGRPPEAGGTRRALRGVVAYQGGALVGWARLADPEVMHKQYQGRLYRNLPCFSGDRSGVATVACFLVAPAHRRAGVARALLSALVELARAEGAGILEAFPRGASDVPDEQHWMGPPQLYAELGFEVVHDFAPYPVVRLSLR